MSFVSYSGSPLYNLNKYIANILKVKDENNNAKNSPTFSNYVKNVPIKDDEIIVHSHNWYAKHNQGLC